MTALNRVAVQAGGRHPRGTTIEMGAEQLPVLMTGAYQIAHERQQHLRNEARDERLARLGRKPNSSSPTWAREFSIVAPTARVGAPEGRDR